MKVFLYKLYTVVLSANFAFFFWPGFAQNTMKLYLNDYPIDLVWQTQYLLLLVLGLIFHACESKIVKNIFFVLIYLAVVIHTCTLQFLSYNLITGITAVCALISYLISITDQEESVLIHVFSLSVLWGICFTIYGLVSKEHLYTILGFVWLFPAMVVFLNKKFNKGFYLS